LIWTTGRFLLLWLTFPVVLASAQPASANDLLGTAKKLSAEKRWQEIVDLLQPRPLSSADLDFYYGTALARLGRWQEAQKAFTEGARLQPEDKRFPQELAGVAFQQKHYSQATRHLRHALKLDPSDAYSNDFLGTVFFLQKNLEAALKYWNRVGK